MHVDIAVLVMIASLAVLGFAVWRVRREPRCMSTGLFIVGGLVLLWFSTVFQVYRYDENVGTLMANGVLYVFVPNALLLVAGAAVLNGGP